MKFIDGFLLVNFLPLALLLIFSFILFWGLKRYKKKRLASLLFVFILLIILSVWRFPVVISRRHVMPIMVLGIIINTYLFTTMPVIFRKFKIRYGRGIIRLLIVVLLIICVCKAMRFQQKKPYLHEIPEILREDYNNHHLSKAIVIFFGNPGGDIEFGPNIDKNELRWEYLNTCTANWEYIFNRPDSKFNIDEFKIQYPHVYLLSRETEKNHLSTVWQKKYGVTPTLIYEYVREKDKTARRLYRISSEYDIAWLSNSAQEKIFKENNILENGDFKEKVKISSRDPVMAALKKKGIKLLNETNFYLPAYWHIIPEKWRKDCMPVIELKPSANGIESQLKMSCKSKISICSDVKIKGKHKYIIAFRIRQEPFSTMLIYTSKYNDGKYVACNYLRDVVSPKQSPFKLVELDLSEFDGYSELELHLHEGMAWIDYVYVVPFSAFKKKIP